jgi:hypothetical protein
LVPCSVELATNNLHADDAGVPRFTSGPLLALSGFFRIRSACLGQIETPRLLCGDRRCEMPRFYFHTRRGQMTVLDQEGFDLPDITHAEDEAKKRAQAIVASEAPKGVPATSGKIIVDDDNGQTVFELEF